MVCPEADQNQNSIRGEMNEDKERYESVDYMKLKSDQSKKTETGPCTALVEIQEVSEIKPNELSSIRTVHELISSEEQEPNGLCSVSHSDKNLATNDPKQEQAVELSSISGSNTSPPNALGTTQELGSSEQQRHDQQTNTYAPRRQSTRKRPLTTRALEALESNFLTSKRMKSTVKPGKCESSNRLAKACNRAKFLSDNESVCLELSKRLNQIEDTKPGFLLNEATTKSKDLDRRQLVVRGMAFCFRINVYIS
ncbi:unnamed protein product [Eruca vesicaria subsp. sativa]|uniref:Uncharacterized protein n=1 Tax=Eruca vesicaria subsp. sativa TaxID=29727 RepID=A0ABC8LK66_ERUVS|nr:unnamed protein product [Eruca vesicaria subsp. sativa]